MILRILTMILSLGAIAALGLYAAWQGPRQELTSWQAVASPLQYEGREIKSGYNRVVGGIDNYIVVAPFGHQINLRLPQDIQVKPLDFISYRGEVQREGYIAVSEIHVHHFRVLKYLSSLIPAIVILVWFVQRYTFRGKILSFVRRP